MTRVCVTLFRVPGGNLGANEELSTLVRSGPGVELVKALPEDAPLKPWLRAVVPSQDLWQAIRSLRKSDRVEELAHAVMLVRSGQEGSWSSVQKRAAVVDGNHQPLGAPLGLTSKVLPRCVGDDFQLQFQLTWASCAAKAPWVARATWQANVTLNSATALVLQGGALQVPKGVECDLDTQELVVLMSVERIITPRERRR